MPSIAYAKMIKGGAEGEEVIVGSKAIVAVGFEVVVAGVKQDVSIAASKQSSGKTRCISFQR